MTRVEKPDRGVGTNVVRAETDGINSGDVLSLLKTCCLWSCFGWTNY